MRTTILPVDIILTPQSVQWPRGLLPSGIEQHEIFHAVSILTNMALSAEQGLGQNEVVRLVHGKLGLFMENHVENA